MSRFPLSWLPLPAGARLVALLVLAATTAQAQTSEPRSLHQRASHPSGPSPVVVPLDAATRAPLTRHRVDAVGPEGTQQCEGVSLAPLLQVAGAMPDAALGSAHLDRYVRIDSRDGGRVVLSLGELDPTLGGRAVYLVDRCDDVPLDAVEGPLRLLVPADARPTRRLRAIERILVIAAP